MFNPNYIAASLGVNIESGGLSVIEEELKVSGARGNVTLSQEAVPFDGSMIAWYKKRGEEDDAYVIGTVTGGKTVSIPDSEENGVYCVKYFYMNPNAKSIQIPTQYVPATLHVVIINDLYAGDIVDVGSANKYGRLITDIPRLQMDGNQNLALTSAGAATVSLTGSALAVSTTESCEVEPIYGTMTQEIFGAKWQDDVIALAIENPEVEIAPQGTDTLIVRAVFGKGMASKRVSNADLTFAIAEAPAATATDAQVGAKTGVITAGSTQGTAVVSVLLTGYNKVEPAYARVTVKNG